MTPQQAANIVKNLLDWKPHADFLDEEAVYMAVRMLERFCGRQPRRFRQYDGRSPFQLARMGRLWLHAVNQ